MRHTRATRLIEPLTITPEPASYTAPEDIADVRNQCDIREPWTPDLQPAPQPPGPVSKPYTGEKRALLDLLPDEFDIAAVCAILPSKARDVHSMRSLAGYHVRQWCDGGLVEVIQEYQPGASGQPAIYRKCERQ